MNSYNDSTGFKTIIGSDVRHAAVCLENEEVIAIPTETVYGLAANALNVQAVQQIFAIKGRPLSNPLIMHVANIDQAATFTRKIPEAALWLMEEFCPGPLTVLLPKNDLVPDVVTAGLPNVAIRIPDHELTLSLLRELDFPLAAPSANPSGYISPTTAAHVRKMLTGKIRYILDGGVCRTGIESTIIGFPDGIPTLFREGAICREQIERVVGKLQQPDHSIAAAPGMLPRHYQPDTRIVVCEDVDHELSKYSHLKVGLITYDYHSRLIPANRQLLLCVNGQLKDAARNLYTAMHAMDEGGYQLIVVKKMPLTGIGAAINDRLLRAAITDVDYVNHSGHSI